MEEKFWWSILVLNHKTSIMPPPHFTTSRIVPFPKGEVQKAWTTPELLASWWGPAGFSNEFEICEIEPDGDWIFTMIGPDGVRYKNISKWQEVTSDHVTLEHVNAPHFLMRAEFEDLGESTKITWTGTFDSPEIYEGLRTIIESANEQNLDRLEACLRK